MTPYPTDMRDINISKLHALSLCVNASSAIFPPLFLGTGFLVTFHVSFFSILTFLCRFTVQKLHCFVFITIAVRTLIVSPTCAPFSLLIGHFLLPILRASARDNLSLPLLNSTNTIYMLVTLIF